MYMISLYDTTRQNTDVRLEIPNPAMPSYLRGVGSGDRQVSMSRKSRQAKFHRFSHSQYSFAPGYHTPGLKQIAITICSFAQ
jgi:hypothetical protein